MQTTSKVYHEYGIRFRIQLHGHPPLPGLEQLCIPGWQPGLDRGQPVDLEFRLEHTCYDDQPALGLTYRLKVNSELALGGGQILEKFVKAASSRLHWFLARDSRAEVFLHAGCVQIGERAVLFPAGSYAGKSTLVAHLASCGAKLLSDEYAVLALKDGQVVAKPFLRPVTLREGAPLPLRPWELYQGNQGLPVGQVFFLEYHEGSALQVDRVGPGAAVLRLFQNAVAAQLRPGEILQLLGQLAQQAACWEGVRGEVGTAVGDFWRASGVERVPSE